MHAEAERLATAFIRDFWSANHDIRWLRLEHERMLWLDKHTVLVGKIDAIGKTMDGEMFFADWKTASKKKARFMDTEKRQWRMNPQALTYGVLLNDEKIWRFTVRWALKTDPATTNFEWYEYSDAELAFWQSELLKVAQQIRSLRGTQPWPVNLHHCTRYGETYACPFRDEGCWKKNFEHVPESMKPRGDGHLKIEALIRHDYVGSLADLVVLDASRVSDWMACHEFYRRLWEDEGLTESSEALTIGTDFHLLIDAHLEQIKKEQDAYAG
jgi:hypothetical protein